jgi:hypothetical protein
MKKEGESCGLRNAEEKEIATTESHEERKIMVGKVKVGMLCIEKYDLHLVQ